MQILNLQCNKPSKVVLDKDLKLVKKEALEMFKLCQKKLGRFPGALALAHCQVDHLNPLRFFVTKLGELIINPRILEIINEDAVNSSEGCMSYAFRNEVKVKRFKKIKVSFQEILKSGKLSKPKIKIVEDLNAFIFQHEIDHFNGKSIYS